MSGERILVVDDEPDLQRLLTFNLRNAGFEAEAVATGEEGIAAAARARPAVIVLDVMLPDMQGFDVCRRIRASADLADVPIMLLTARSDEQDRVRGFEVGTDDYVVKPFSVREIVMRVRALVRLASERRGVPVVDPPEVLRWKDLEVDVARRRAFVDGNEVLLRPLELKLIATLLSAPGKVFTRVELLDRVWGTSGEISPRTVDTHVRRLRDALHSHGHAVETVFRSGYRLRAAP
jgi:two-component system phosphate regulon response regulator PhoB